MKNLTADGSVVSGEGHNDNKCTLRKKSSVEAVMLICASEWCFFYEAAAI